MTQRKTFSIGSCLVTLFLALPMAAQDTNRFAFHIGGGFTPPVYSTSSRLDTGFNIVGGAGYNFTPHFGIGPEFSFNNLDLTRRALSAAGVPDGSTRVYSATLNPIIRFNPYHRFDFYLTGGGGFYRRTVEFTQPTVSIITVFDPFYGAFFPTAVPAHEVLGSFTQNKGGLNIGGGVSVRAFGDSNTKFFAEARYHHIYTTPVRTAILPVTFGIRW